MNDLLLQFTTNGENIGVVPLSLSPEKFMRVVEEMLKEHFDSDFSVVIDSGLTLFAQKVDTLPVKKGSGITSFTYPSEFGVDFHCDGEEQSEVVTYSLTWIYSLGYTPPNNP